jgi:hypothetical protein
MSEVAWREERVRDLQRLVSEARAAFADDDASRRWQHLLELRQHALAAAEAMLDTALQLERYYAVRRFDDALAELRAADAIVVPVARRLVTYWLAGGRLGTRIMHDGRFYAIGDELDAHQAHDLADAGWSVETRPT